VANRTQIVCLHEGEAGRSVDSVFINRLLRSLRPSWIRPWGGSNTVRLEPCGGRKALIEAFPKKLQEVLSAGGNTTLMVWADLDHDMENGDKLREVFWKQAQQHGITRSQFDQVVFVFAKDRIENWVQFLLTGATDESQEGPRLKNDKQAADAAHRLADYCLRGASIPNIPPSLEWSCRNWRTLVDRMR
jgi:hypothetical protein